MNSSFKSKLLKTVVLAGILASYSGLVLAETSIGSVANQLEGTANVLTKVMWAACLLVGVGFIIASVTQYQIHRYNPKLVPLGNPITYLVLGLVAMSIPFLYDLFGLDKEAGMQEKKKQAYQYYDPTDVDRPVQGPPEPP